MGTHPRRLRKLTAGPAGAWPASDPDGAAPGRRRFLKQAALAGATVGLASQVAPLGGLVPAASGQTGSPQDRAVARAAGIELALAEAYAAAAATGVLTEPTSELVRVYGARHTQHASTFNGLLAEAVTEADPVVAGPATTALRGASDEAGVLATLIGLEEGAASSHYQALGTVDQHAAATFAGILAVEAQQATALAGHGGSPAAGLLVPAQDGDRTFDPVTTADADDTAPATTGATS